MVGYMISAVLLLVAIVLAGKLLLQRKRLRDLAESMEDYLNGGGEPAPFSLREDAAAPVENAASELENRIAVLTERLREENARTSSLTADISHQLKTPLASLRLFVEMDESAHMAEELGQIERMEKLIGSLLRLEKLCADGYEFAFAEQAVRPLIENAWDSLRALWPEKRMEIEGDAALRCDGKWCGRLDSGKDRADGAHGLLLRRGYRRRCTGERPAAPVRALLSLGGSGAKRLRPGACHRERDRVPSPRTRQRREHQKRSADPFGVSDPPFDENINLSF